MACPQPIDENHDLNALARLAKAGDPAARAAFCEVAYPFVWALVWREGWYLPAGAGGDREDLVQEAVFRLVLALDTWDPDRWRDFPTFATMVSRRDLQEQVTFAYRQKRSANIGAVSLNRRAYRDKHGQEDPKADDRLATWQLPDPSGIGRDPGDVVAELDADPLLEALTEGFTPIERAAFFRCVIGRESYTAVSAEIGRAYKAVDNATQRAKAKLLRRAGQLAQGCMFSPEVRALLAGFVAENAGRYRKVSHRRR